MSKNEIIGLRMDNSDLRETNHALKLQKATLEAEIEEMEKLLLNAGQKLINLGLESSARITQLEADLQAAQAIIVDAGKQVETLKAENARAKMNMQNALNMLDNPTSYMSTGNARDLLRSALESTEAQAESATPADVPKFTIGDKVILAGEPDKGTRTIHSIHPTTSGEYQYKVLTPSGNVSDNYWYESELEAQS